MIIARCVGVGQANIGFLCMAKVDGKRCVSRQLFTPDPPDAIVKTVPSHTVLSSSAVAGVPAGPYPTVFSTKIRLISPLWLTEGWFAWLR
jgi:hypothetical protein